MTAPLLTAPTEPSLGDLLRRVWRGLGRCWRAVRRYHRWPAPSAPRMTRICAWCDRILERGGPTRTHGICEACRAKHFPETH